MKKHFVKQYLVVMKGLLKHTVYVVGAWGSLVVKALRY
jgi:hypothetical protein